MLPWGVLSNEKTFQPVVKNLVIAPYAYVYRFTDKHYTSYSRAAKLQNTETNTVP
jgi:hypothetical protein